MTPTRTIALACLTTLVACSKPDAKPADSVPVVAAPAPATSSAAPAGPGCPETGAWVKCSVEKRFERQGLVATAKDTVRPPFLHVPGLRYDLGGGRGEVQVFLYADSAARARDSGAMDTTTASPKGGKAYYAAPPSVILSNNLLAILVSNNETLVERVQLALGAGMPR